MITVAIGALALAAASVLLGRAVLTLAGWRGSHWIAAAVGYALLLALAGNFVELSDGALIAGIVGALLAALSLALPRVRHGLLDVALDGLPLAIVVLLAAMVPFFVFGRAYVPGAGRDNDMVAHLTATWWLQTFQGPEPVGAFGEPLYTGGYPLGPHSLAAALQQVAGVSVVHAFDIVATALPIVGALTVLGAFGARRLRGRSLVAGVVGLAYLATSYIVQGTIKEAIEGMLLVAFVIALQELVRVGGRPSVREGLVFAAIGAGTVYSYSYAGIVWLVAAAGLFALFELVRRRGRVLRAILPALGVTAVALVGIAVLVATQIDRMVTFADSSYAAETGPGNLVTALPIREALGIWLQGDYRYVPDQATLDGLLIALAAALLLVAVAWRLWRRQLAVLAGLAGALLIYWQATKGDRGIYTEAKALVIMAPIAALAWTGPLPELWRRSEPRERLVLRAGRWAVGAVGLVAIAGACASTFLALRNAPVAPVEPSRQLEALRPLIGQQPTLYLGMDDFGRFDLRGANIYTGPQLYSPPDKLAPLRPSKIWRIRSPLDFDNFSPQTLDAMTFVITPAAAYQSTPPSNFRVVRRTAQYLLWQRFGPTPPRAPAERNGVPGAFLRCDTRRGRFRLARDRYAAVLPPPVLGNTLNWSGPPNRVGRSSTQVVQLPAGTWDLSMQYESATGIVLRAGDLRTLLPPTLATLGSFWPAGIVHQPHDGAVSVTATVPAGNWFASLVGAPGTRRLVAPGNRPVARLAFTRHGAQPQVIPTPQACNQYVDYYLPT